MRSITGLMCVVCLTALSAGDAAARVDVPRGFTLYDISPALNSPTALAFAPDGRLFIAQKDGLVRVVQDGALLPSPFIDLRAEVGNSGDRGLLGLALDPNFNANRFVYLLYTVDPVFGDPDETMFTPSFGRVTRYTGTAASGGSQADSASRLVLLGSTSDSGPPSCWSSHTVGALRFGNDGSLLVSAGDGARWEMADPGGQTPDCLKYMSPAEDIGAFRAQRLDSLAGKILRINPANGQGYPDNPYFTGNANDRRSKVWLSGLRNPFRFSVRSGTPGPGTLAIGDVGWFDHEELSVVAAAQAGANMGWPCREGFVNAGIYPFAQPSSFGCSTLETLGNPGDLTFPILTVHHSDTDQSNPPGVTGSAIVAGPFPRATYPQPYRDGLFLADFVSGWIRFVQLDASNRVTDVHPFASDANGVVDFAIDPLTGDVCFLSLIDGVVRRIDHMSSNPADIDGDGTVDVDDLLAVINGWGPCSRPPCPSDLTGNGTTNVDDLLLVINNWG